MEGGILVGELFSIQYQLIFRTLKDCQQTVRSGNRRRTNEERLLLPLSAAPRNFFSM